MIVVTAGTSEYRPIVEAQARKCAEFGYRHVIYDLGGLGLGESYEVPASDLKPTVNGDSLPPATFKAELVAKQFETALPGEFVCWLDADCLPLMEFAPWAEHADIPAPDAIVTLRPAPEVGLSNNPALDYLNSGVVWIRNTEAGRKFCADWRELSGELQTDQGALNEAVAGVCKVGEGEFWNSARGGFLLTSSDATVLVLDCAEWNSWHPPFTGARIAHFKRGIRGQAKDYINR